MPLRRLAGVLSRALRFLLVAGGLLAFAGIGAAIGVYLVFMRDLPDLRTLDDYQPFLATQVVDRHGQPIGEFFSERRRLTPLANVPAHVVNAFVAGEDSAFFEHKGVDFTSILRAAWVNLRTGGEIKQGGSTITQQMVKGLLLSPERTYRRKIRELILAWSIERHLTKQEILYLYLNQIYFGHGAYGIGEAAQTYFGKDVSALSVSEGAQLAGLPKAPSRYSPFANPEAADQRRRYVLDRMLEEKLIDAKTHASATLEVPRLRELSDEDHIWEMAYFTEEVRRELFEKLGGDVVLRGGLVVETTLDADLERTAVAALRRGLVELDERQAYRGPLRKVAPAAIPDEIAKLAVENGFAPPPPAPEAGAPAAALAAAPAAPAAPARPPAATLKPGSASPATDAVAWVWPVASRKGARPIDPRGGPQPLVGVVTKVDGAGQSARVAFAPGREAEVKLEDVSWAREPDPDSAPHPVGSIDKVFRRGDVALFVPVDVEKPAAAKPGAPAGLRRATLFQEPTVEGALLSLDVRSGEVLALVGGWDFDRSQFDRATQARRQPGSAFKPVIYAAALAKGYTASSILFDRPVVYVDETSGFVWRPQNYGKSFYGPITMREALARSVNNATVHLFRDVGVDYVISFARRLGIQAPLQRDLSLALGSSPVSLLELTRAYAMFAASGKRVVPSFIRRVLDAKGNVLLENVELGDAPLPEALPGPAAPAPAAPVPSAPVDVVAADTASGAVTPGLTPEEAYLATDLLRAPIMDPHGTGARARELGRPLAGKTGTTNEQADAWFMGFSPDVVTGVWVGHDESRFLGWGETGARAALPIWLEFMKAATAPYPVRDFPVPEGIVFARVDRKTGLLAESDGDETVFQAYRAGAEPTENVRAAEDSAENRRALRMDSF